MAKQSDKIADAVGHIIPRAIVNSTENDSNSIRIPVVTDETQTRSEFPLLRNPKKIL
jgi:hypothetical protein